MKIVIAGSRSFNDGPYMEHVLNNLGLPEDVELVCGMARGADMTAYHIFKQAGLPIHQFPAKWEEYGKSAGFRRNADMAIAADQGIVFWDGVSRGAAHMIEMLDYYNKPCIVVEVPVGESHGQSFH